MKRTMTLLLLAVVLTAVSCMSPIALAAEVCYPTAVEQSEDGGEIRKVYDLSPEQDPAGIPRSDFEQDGVHYTLTDLLKQEMPEYQERQHTEEVSLESKNKDMASILALLPQEKEFVTEDGLSGTLTLQLDTVQPFEAVLSGTITGSMGSGMGITGLISVPSKTATYRTRSSAILLTVPTYFAVTV